MPTWLVVLMAFGVNNALWGSMSFLRLIEDRLARRKEVESPLGHGERQPSGGEVASLQGGGNERRAGRRMSLADVAVLIPAHNEALVISRTLEAILEIVPRANVFVISDASTDSTVKEALRHGVQVAETPVNVGKAGALEFAVKYFQLVEYFDVVLLLDADSQLKEGYFEAALPLLDDPAVVAVAGCAETDWNSGVDTYIGKMLLTHRSRVYALTQRLIKMGQTRKSTNALYIIPGFASLYRTSILPQMEMNPRGLVIEDFNMTFEVYRHRLGKVACSLAACAKTQDPDNFREYVGQTKRWALGFWQTVKRHGFRFRFFWLALTVLCVELVVSSAILLLLPLVMLFYFLPALYPTMLSVPTVSELHVILVTNMNVAAVTLAIVIPDLILTLFVSFTERKIRYLFFAPAFLPMRMVDAAITLYSVPRALFKRSDGRWTSPTRRPVPIAADTPERLAS
ncbi:MAG TPA: glycosyltransferase family 2 protein [Pseudonocardia sp.]|jgi:cellulose synthase/poly-beta-1,6-N-acetylglucosamine synthase-like glycosyltransferase|nr:glycosyltransferase family 2 protein [Pseudonocardia sp.]